MPNFEVIRRNFQPAAVGSAETTTIYTAAKGQRVIAASMKLLTAAAASTSCTIEVGDAADTDGYVKGSDLDLETATVASIVAGTGDYFGTTYKAGKLYTASTAITAKYVIGTPGATNPKVQISLVIVREFPAG